MSLFNPSLDYIVNKTLREDCLTEIEMQVTDWARDFNLDRDTVLEYVRAHPRYTDYCGYAPEDIE